MKIKTESLHCVHLITLLSEFVQYLKALDSLNLFPTSSSKLTIVDSIIGMSIRIVMIKTDNSNLVN